MTPMHFDATDTHGLAIYDGGRIVAQTHDRGEMHALALALLLGQSSIGGVPIPDDRTRYGIVGAAMKRLLAEAT